jgi:hypothetical protein
MTNHKYEELDINELTQLTPFGLDVYQNRSKFSAGHLFVKTRILESAKPLQPWSNDAPNKLESVTSTNV